ncbi:hypothetical protein [Pseudonocardia thermophila]|nr:hypothetical protein [Pseudonocardia thermophila]
MTATPPREKDRAQMVALPEGRAAAHATSFADSPRRTGPVAARRAVAVAASTTELLRPQSDLARILESFDEIDLLIVADEREHGGGVVPLPVARVGGAPVDLSTLDLDDCDVAVLDDLEDEEEDDPAAELDRAIAALGLPRARAHRLGFAPGFGGEAEPDIVAAMSELVGFDPEPGVYCLAPAAADGPDGAVARAARRIAQVYGLPLLSYRCLELAVVDGELPAPTGQH